MSEKAQKIFNNLVTNNNVGPSGTGAAPDVLFTKLGFYA